MRSVVGGRHALLLFVIACTGRAIPSTPLPPTPVIPRSDSGAVTARTWSFSYEPGTGSYHIKRTATIEDVSDSMRVREAATNLTHETLALERIGDTIQVTITADTFATASQGLPQPIQSVALPVHLAALLSRDDVQLVADSSTEQECNAARSALRSDLHNLITPFPPQLTRGMMWTDSVELKSCQGMIPTTANIGRSYSVTGETIYNGIPVLVIERRDVIRAHGDGAQQQHQVTIDATGTGSAVEYLNIATGRIVTVTTTQELSLTIRASGQAHHFKQSLEQELVLAR
jgi:hypothetical protein